MTISRRKNMLRAVRFERPDYIPVQFHINAACWFQYPHEALYELMAAHPLLFPSFSAENPPAPPTPPPWQQAGVRYTDPWGCVWETGTTGLTGRVVEPALPTWDAFEDYEPPDPAQSSGLQPIDWNEIAAHVAEDKAAERLARGGLRHGHTFLTLSDIRGYENLIYDMADERPELNRLIDMVEGFNLGIVERYLACGVEYMAYPEDLGMQMGPMISPVHFREYIKPVYERLMAPARDAGCIIHMHSDGDIRSLVDDLVSSGVQVLNLQDLVNGLDWIESRLKGRVCIDLDIDRQQITRFGTPAQIDALIREEVSQLGSPEGGLMMIHGMYPGVPLENARALMDAMERYATYYA
jgi:uroporphyrinogen-III decarboxylase